MFLKSRTFYFFSLLLSVMSDVIYCRSVGERFDMGKSSASDSFMKVKVLNDIAGLSGSEETDILLFLKSFSALENYHT